MSPTLLSSPPSPSPSAKATLSQTPFASQGVRSYSFKRSQFAEPPHFHCFSSSSSSSSSSCFFNQPSWPRSAAPSSQFVYANRRSQLLTRIFGNPDADDHIVMGLCKCASSDCSLMRRVWILNDLQKWVEFDATQPPIVGSGQHRKKEVH